MLGIDQAVIEKATWQDQPTKLRDPGRKLFHLEHMVPVAQLANLIVENKDASEEELALLLMRQDIAWITKEQDVELTRRGYRSFRVDPILAYHEAGIRFVNSIIFPNPNAKS